MTPTDTAFLKAITTIKAISRGPNALEKPPPKRKVQLYGLYKQATEGDVNGIMPRPEGVDPQTKANQLKWDAWKSQQGKSKPEAKLDYVAYLLETIRSLAPSNDVENLPTQWLELEQVYRIAREDLENNSNTGGSSGGGGGGPGARNERPRTRRQSIGSVNSSYSHFLRNTGLNSPRQGGTFSEFGLSEKDRSELQADQLVDRLQSVYPPVIPGAVPLPPVHLPTSYENQRLGWNIKDIPHNNIPQANALDPSRNSKGNSNGGPSWIAWFIYHFQRVTVSTLERLLRRIIVDGAALIALATILRLLASRPHLLEKLPVLKGVTKTLIKVGLVIMDGFGVELKLKSSHGGALRGALQRGA